MCIRDRSKQISAARHCQISELAAMLSFCGRIQISENNRYRIKIHTENGAVARKCFTLLKKTFNIGADVSIRRNAFQKKSHTYTVAVQDHQEALKVLQATKLLQEDGEIGDSLSLVNNVISVSYTHLDVYKRQAMERWQPAWTISAQ